jgi:hypothetical protein
VRDGVDYRAGDDPVAKKRTLDEAHCDPDAREPCL